MIAKQGCTIEHQNSKFKYKTSFFGNFCGFKIYITFCVFLNKLNNSDQCDSSVDCLAHFSMRGNYSSLHPYQTDLWYVFLLFIFFTVVYSLNPSDLFGSLGVNHWTAWWGNSLLETWSQKKRLEKISSHDFGLKWFEILWMWWTIFLPYGCLFCGFLSSFFPWILLALIEKTKVQLFQTRFALLSNSFAVYKKKKKCL